MVRLVVLRRCAVTLGWQRAVPGAKNVDEAEQSSNGEKSFAVLGGALVILCWLAMIALIAYLLVIRRR